MTLRFPVGKRTLAAGSLVALLAGGTVAAQQVGVQCHTDGRLPDRHCTPGAVLTVDASAICHAGYAASVRNVTLSTKLAVARAYGVLLRPGAYEIDHLVSLELGGSNDPANLWPEPYTGRLNAHDKDRVEDWTHREVCAGRLSLADAQARIATDWMALGRELGQLP